MNKQRVSSLLSIFFLSFSLILVSGCYKKKDTMVKIHVRDVNNNLVSGVKVVLYGESSTPRPSSFGDTAISNTAGEAIFNLNYMYKAGQAGVAVLNISANKLVVGGSPLTGSGIIKVVEQETTDETIFVQP